MRRRHHLIAVAVALELCAGFALADDPAQQAHAIMREALLERAGATASSLKGSHRAAPSVVTIAREHMDRTRKAEAERAAHRRAVEHGTRRSGAGRPDRETHATPGSVHGGNHGAGSWGTDCQDAAGNSRTMEMHEGWMPGGGMPGGGMGGGMLTGATPTGASGTTATPASDPTRR